MNHGGKVQLDAGEREQVMPKIAGEDGILVADHLTRNVVHVHNGVEEGTSNGGGRVGVP
jgi:hypothetical protein